MSEKRKPDEQPEQPQEKARQQLDPEPPEPGTEGYEDSLIHLPALVSDEFGVSRSIARMEIMMGQVEIDGEPYTGESKLDIPYKLIAGKKIAVIGDTRHFLIDYKG
jgi:hypothetical protein